jgi:hypothetical protein
MDIKSGQPEVIKNEQRRRENFLVSLLYPMLAHSPQYWQPSLAGYNMIYTHRFRIVSLTSGAKFISPEPLSESWMCLIDSSGPKISAALLLG